MNGADSEVRIKLINFNRHFKDRHIFSSDLYFKIKKDIRKVAHSSPGLLRDLKILLTMKHILLQHQNQILIQNLILVKFLLVN